MSDISSSALDLLDRYSDEFSDLLLAAAETQAMLRMELDKTSPVFIIDEDVRLAWDALKRLGI